MNLKKNFRFNDVRLINFINLDKNEKEKIRLWRNAKTIRKCMFQDHIIIKKEHARFMNRLKTENKNFYWLVKKSEKEVGVIALIKLDLENRNGYLGIYANPYVRIKGAGRILLQALKKIAFQKSRLNTLKLEVIENNNKAIDFYKRNGFIREGRLKDFVLRGRKKLDVIVMGSKR